MPRTSTKPQPKKSNVIPNCDPHECGETHGHVCRYCKDWVCPKHKVPVKDGKGSGLACRRCANPDTRLVRDS